MTSFWTYCLDFIQGEWIVIYAYISFPFSILFCLKDEKFIIWYRFLILQHIAFSLSLTIDQIILPFLNYIIFLDSIIELAVLGTN